MGDLRNLGHNVFSIAEHSPGISEEEVLRLSRADHRVIVTFDRDYGEFVLVGGSVRRFMDNSPSVAYFESCDGMCRGRSGENLERVIG
ncbi:DUF5615 family PIN-like protein [Candidatus Rariloculus sp.]|uniref:DUF5615 family PIN-like protein n=1 Tax=Candidatus Rariloculus sp. TaxID=3101265 RepID=UPI003D0BAF6C